MRVPVLCLLACLVFPSVTHAQRVPVFEVSKADSVIKFSVSASVKIEGNFDKWDASMTFTSPELSTAVLTSRFRQTV
jgi:polyisoprenoid-binding protein YceI